MVDKLYVIVCIKIPDRSSQSASPLAPVFADVRPALQGQHLIGTERCCAGSAAAPATPTNHRRNTARTAECEVSG